MKKKKTELLQLMPAALTKVTESISAAVVEGQARQLSARCFNTQPIGR